MEIENNLASKIFPGYYFRLFSIGAIIKLRCETKAKK
jgi:hypothetical protein